MQYLTQELNNSAINNNNLEKIVKAAVDIVTDLNSATDEVSSSDSVLLKLKLSYRKAINSTMEKIKTDRTYTEFTINFKLVYGCVEKLQNYYSLMIFEMGQNDSTTTYTEKCQECFQNDMLSQLTEGVVLHTGSDDAFVNSLKLMLILYPSCERLVKKNDPVDISATVTNKIEGYLKSFFKMVTPIIENNFANLTKTVETGTKAIWWDAIEILASEEVERIFKASFNSMLFISKLGYLQRWGKKNPDYKEIQPQINKWNEKFASLVYIYYESTVEGMLEHTQARKNLFRKSVNFPQLSKLLKLHEYYYQMLRNFDIDEKDEFAVYCKNNNPLFTLQFYVAFSDSVPEIRQFYIQANNNFKMFIVLYAACTGIQNSDTENYNNAQANLIHYMNKFKELQYLKKAPETMLESN